jgi:type II secretory pathway component PulF
VRLDNQTQAQFADAMATCLSSGLTPKRSLELSGARSPSKAFREVIRVALERCDQGMPISEALEPGARIFPHYFLPVIRAGEAGGRLVEAFQLLSQYAYRVGPSVRLVRNTWLYPLICIVFGWVIRTGIFVYFGKYVAARQFVWATFGTGLLVALGGWLLFKLPLVKRVIDLGLLQIPLIRETEIRLAVVLFFSTFRLAYEAGGLGVVVMFDLAWQTVRNDAIRRDLLKARRIMEQNGTFGDAFADSALLGDNLKSMINTGSISGRLDQTLTKVVETATQQLEMSLQIFNQLFQRLIVGLVGLSIIETLWICIM